MDTALFLVKIPRPLIIYLFTMIFYSKIDDIKSLEFKVWVYNDDDF